MLRMSQAEVWKLRRMGDPMCWGTESLGTWKGGQEFYHEIHGLFNGEFIIYFTEMKRQ